MLFFLKILNWDNLIFVDDGNILEMEDIKPRVADSLFPINYFSIFKLRENKYYNFIFNDYKLFENQKNKKHENLTLFIGQPFVELKMISQKKYQEILEDVVDRENNLYYCPHPRENKKNYTKIRGIKLLNLNGGLEHYFIAEKYIPKKIISFYSTSLFSFSILFNNISINYIDLSEILNFNYGKENYIYLNKELNISKYI